jgi:hypothetical protein
MCVVIIGEIVVSGVVGSVSRVRVVCFGECCLFRHVFLRNADAFRVILPLPRQILKVAAQDRGDFNC